MERLDACYFCGTAADAPLREVSIAPRDRRDDPDATVQVTLCPTCESKLERVLSGLFDHVESRQGVEQDREEPSDAGPTGDAAAEDDPPDQIDRIDISSGGDEADRRGGQGRRRLFSDSPAGEPAGGASEDRPTVDGDAEIVDDEPRVRARATAEAGDPLDGVSISEYNRVVRLLQNRAFPMERLAFVDLAASAYDLGEETVQAVLDALIEEGTLEEREGALDRPAEGGP